MLHAIRLDFDPAISPFGLTVRLETLALAGAILLALLVVGLLAGRARAAAERDAPGSEESRLRRDDLILIAFGAVPGAVLGGRLGYGLAHLDFYGSDPGALLDPGKGSLSLTGALLLGTVSALAVARLIGTPVRTWLHLAATPLLLGLGLGKLAGALGGSGQGAFSEASWATAYVAPGDWGSLDAADPAIPSQAIEGGLVLLVLAGLVLVPQLLRLRATRSPRPGLRLAPAREWSLLAGSQRFVTAVALWAAVRFGVAFTWRDGRVAGPLTAEHFALAVLIVACAWALARPWAPGALRRRAERRAVSRAQREAKREAKRQAKLEAKRQAKLEAERKATLEAERLAALEAGRRARLETERQVKRLTALEAKLEAKRRAKLEAQRQAELEAQRQAAVPTEAAPEYPREESGAEVEVVPERDRVEPAKRPTRRGTHRPRAPKPRRPPPGSGS